MQIIFGTVVLVLSALLLLVFLVTFLYGVGVTTWQLWKSLRGASKR